MYRCSYGLLLAMIIPMPVCALGISVDDWNYSSSSFTPVTTAGNYYPSIIESAGNAAVMNLSGAPSTPVNANPCDPSSNPAWRINAELQSTPASAISVEIRRTNGGTGGTLNGGESYILLNSSIQPLFTGCGNVTGINLQFKIDNLDTADGNGNKLWHVKYTLETL